MLATVVGVSDGDTLVVIGPDQAQHRVRLAGIDAPEKSQPFGSRSKQALADAVHRKVVRLDWQKTDRYGRLVAKVIVGHRDIGLQQLIAGMAWHYKAYEREQSASDRRDYAAAQAKAMQRRAGLWTQSKPVPPWDFRRSNSR